MESTDFRNWSIPELLDFGDNLDRRVVFEGGDVSQLTGQPVTMEMELSDADVYSFQFMP